MNLKLIELQHSLYGTAIIWFILFLILILTLKFRKKIFYPCWKDTGCDASILTIIFYIIFSISFAACCHNLFDDVFYFCHPDYYLSLVDKK